MAIVIKPFTEELVPSVKEFNRRLSEAGRPPDFQFPEVPAQPRALASEGAKVCHEHYVALEGDTVRGGYILRIQDFSFYGRIVPAAFYRLPLSEGTVNKKYVSVGVQMLRSAAQAQPHLFGLGMGGFDRPLPKMLKAMRWELTLVPFFFKVVHAKPFLREMKSLRKTRLRRALMDFAAFTGTGGIGIHSLQAVRRWRGKGARGLSVEVVREFSNWADDLWGKVHAEYSMTAARDSATLNALYSEQSDRVLRLKVSRGDDVVGWVVVLNGRMRENKHFGNLKVGTIADYLSLPGSELAVILAAVRKLEDDGADLLIASESNASWTAALTRAGFLQGPSNIVFAASPKLAGLLQPFDAHYPKTHLNFGDGDGPFDLYR